MSTSTQSCVDTNLFIENARETSTNTPTVIGRLMIYTHTSQICYRRVWFDPLNKPLSELVAIVLARYFVENVNFQQRGIEHICHQGYFNFRVM